MINLTTLLEDSELAEKAECLQEAFDTAGIKNLEGLDNAPRLLGRQVCGLDVYQVIDVVRGRLTASPKKKQVRKK